MSFWWRQRKWEGAGYHQHSNEPPLDAPCKAQSQRRLQPLHYLFNLQMTVSPNAILPSIKSRGSWIYKRQSGGWLPPAALLGPIIQARLSPVSLHFCFHPKGYSPAKPPGSIKVGHAYWTSQVDCKYKLNVDTKCHLFLTSLVLGGKDSRGQVFSPFSSMCTSLPSPTKSIPRLLSCWPPSPSTARSLSAVACVPLSLPQLSDHTSELAFWRLRLNPWINLYVDSKLTNQWFHWNW